MHLTPTYLQDLLLDPATHPRGQPHLSAASGLVRAGAWLYLVADDEHHLALLPADAALLPQAPQAPQVQLHRILPGDLPTEPRERKKRKPDLEALALLPASPAHPHGALLALGSGSKPNRQRGLVIALDASGRPDGGAAQVVDLSALYAPLRAQLADLNIEGVFVANEALHLLQRGNKGDARNACITYPLAPLLVWLAGTSAQPPAPLRTTLFDLGTVDGVPLGFTDGAALPGSQGGWIFSAVAENTDDSYADGECVASAIGWVGADGVLQRMVALEGAPKVEGIALDGDGWLLMATDADDPERASRLLVVALD